LAENAEKKKVEQQAKIAKMKKDAIEKAKNEAELAKKLADKRKRDEAIA